MTPPDREQGMALVSVLLAVALAAAVLAIMLSGEDAAFSRAARMDEAARARAIARGGELSAITALRRDLVTAPLADDAHEAWAHIGDRATPITGGTFTLAIADARGKLDLNPLARGDTLTLARLSALVRVLGLPDTVAQRIAAGLAITGPISDLAQLQAFGIEPDAIARLATAAAALPLPGPINLNAAPEPLLAVLVENPVAAHGLIGRRDRNGGLVSGDLIQERVLMPAGSGFTSDLYAVDTAVTIGTTRQRLTSLLERKGTGNRAEVIVIARRIRG